MATATADVLRAVERDQPKSTWQGNWMFILGMLSVAIGGCMVWVILGLSSELSVDTRVILLVIMFFLIGIGVLSVVTHSRVDDYFLAKKRAQDWRLTFKRLNPDADLDALDRVVAYMRQHTGYGDITFERISNIFEHVTKFRTEPAQSLWFEAMKNYYHFHDGSQELATTLCPKQ